MREESAYGFRLSGDKFFGEGQILWRKCKLSGDGFATTHPAILSPFRGTADRLPVVSGPSIRVSTKAVIIDTGDILVTRNLHPDDPGGEFFLLPGGGQNHGEPLDECLRREVREETGYSVEVGDVLWVRDYIGARHEFAAHELDVHQVEIMFSCSIDRSQPPGRAVEEDAWQISVDWVPLEELANVRFFPAALVAGLVALVGDGAIGPRYLGDIN